MGRRCWKTREDEVSSAIEEGGGRAPLPAKLPLPGSGGVRGRSVNCATRESSVSQSHTFDGLHGTSLMVH